MNSDTLQWSTKGCTCLLFRLITAVQCKKLTHRNGLPPSQTPLELEKLHSRTLLEYKAGIS